MTDFEDCHAAIARLRRRRLFFIGGAPKSGTTWLQLLLDQHPGICCNGEGNFTNALIPLLVQAMDSYNGQIAWKNEAIFTGLPGYPRLDSGQRRYLWIAAMALLLDAQARTRPRAVIGEKTPDNVRHFALLADAFPQARFIHIVRDGRDAAVSNWFHNLRLSEEQTRATFGDFDSFVIRFAAAWAADVAAGTAFGEAAPERCLLVRYEDLVADTTAGIAQVFRFLGVRAGRDLAASCAAGGRFETLSGGRAPGDEDRASFFRQGRPGDWRNHLTGATASRFAAEAGPWLARFGYA